MDEKEDNLSKAKGYFAAFIGKFQYNSPVILTFAAVSFAVLLLGWATGGGHGSLGHTTELLFSVTRPQTLAEPLFFFNLLGHSLGHVDIAHFLNNFLIILLVGPVLEEKYGSRKLLLMMVATSVIIGILHAVLTNFTTLLGASGVAFMFIILNSYVNLKEGKIPVTLVLCVFIFMGREIAGHMDSDIIGISHFSHIIGGLCGVLFGYLFNFKLKKKTVEEAGDDSD